MQSTDTDGSEGDWCDESDEIEANRWLVCDEESVGVGHSATGQVQKIPDNVCAENEGMGSVLGGVATGHKESISPVRPQSRFQSHEVARTESVFHGVDGQAWKREFYPDENDTWLGSSGARESSGLHTGHGDEAAKMEPS